MIDTHCHLTDPRLLGQIENVLSRAAAAGVDKIVTIGTRPGDWDAATALVAGRHNLRCALGVHPNHCHEVDLAEIAQLRGFQQNPGVVALGEMGLDYHYEFAPKTRQAQFLEAQLALAAELRRPVIIHCREAVDDCLAILRNFGHVKAVFHCFTGTMDEANRIFAAGHLIGFTGVITFRNGESLRAIAAAAPADRILVETDAPYLSPEPLRKQKINEPALVMHTAAAVAAARGVTVAELDRLTTRNALEFYKWGN
jgi:TatD DNase family protein